MRILRESWNLNSNQRVRRVDDNWTWSSFEKYIKSLLNERDRRYEQRFRAQQEAIAKAERATELRFGSVNEFRQTLTDQANEFASQESLDGLRDRIDRLEKIIHLGEGKAHGSKSLWIDARANLALIISLIGGAIGLFVFLMRILK